MSTMSVMYIFFIKGGGFTPIEAKDDNEARKHIELNPGRYDKVMAMGMNPEKDRLVWEEKTD